MAWIYVIKNNINDKLYVGKTEVGIEERFKRHVRDAKNGSECAIHRAMRKHGVKHFWPELIEETDNPNEREVYWIKELGAYEHGYNETRGGEGSLLHDRDYIIDTYNRLGTLESVAIETGISLRTVVQVMRAADSYQKKLLQTMNQYSKIYNRADSENSLPYLKKLTTILWNFFFSFPTAKNNEE